VRVTFIITAIGVVWGQALAAETTSSPSTRSALVRELRALNAELSPARIEARKTPEMQEARKQLDEAYHQFYDALDKKVIQLNPKMKRLVQRRRQVRDQLKTLSVVPPEPEAEPAPKPRAKSK
jgi:hypothetical protein